MTLHRFLSKPVILIILLGLIPRLVLLLAMPLWHDEAYSIYASQSPLLRIFQGLVDPVHPPGFYLVIKFWSLISLHLYWLRLLSLLIFIINALLIGKIFSRNALLVYSFSGYFLIFDWQVRMYTLVLMVILCNLIVLNNLLSKRPPSHGYIQFILINVFGLYLDYSYFWYFIPASMIFSILYLRKKDLIYYKLFISSIFSSALFLLIYPGFPQFISSGLDGIIWVKPYLSPSFFIPYFLGSHLNIIATCIFIFLILIGLKKIKSVKFIERFVIAVSFISGVSLYIFSWLFSPVFHVRSLEIISLATILLICLGIGVIHKFSKTTLTVALTVFIFFNMVFNTYYLYFDPELYLISPFPWKQVLDRSTSNDLDYRVDHPLPTPLLLWGLEYSASGLESFPMRTIKLNPIGPNSDLTGCGVLTTYPLSLFVCSSPSPIRKNSP